jgi:hypothetical protein
LGRKPGCASQVLGCIQCAIVLMILFIHPLFLLLNHILVQSADRPSSLMILCRTHSTFTKAFVRNQLLGSTTYCHLLLRVIGPDYQRYMKLFMLLSSVNFRHSNGLRMNTVPHFKFSAGAWITTSSWPFNHSPLRTENSWMYKFKDCVTRTELLTFFKYLSVCNVE